MGVYCELTLLPNPEVNIHFLWSKVFQQIHLGLVEIQDEQNRVPIGVSFPEYVVEEKRIVLGSKLRLFANDEATLERFNVLHWLSRLSDYVHCTSIRTVPEKLTSYATYQRVQPKANKSRLAKRYAKRHNISYESALECYSKLEYKSVSLPFIRLKSLSTDAEFCLWVRKTLVAEPVLGSFGSYGLSLVATVPEF